MLSIKLKEAKWNKEHKTSHATNSQKENFLRGKLCDKNFQTLNDFDKYIEPWGLCSALLQNTLLQKYRQKKNKKKEKNKTQRHSA